MKQHQCYQERPKTYLKKFRYSYTVPTNYRTNSLCDEVKMNMTAVIPQIKRGSISKIIFVLSNHTQQMVCVPWMLHSSLGPGHPAEMLGSTYIHKQVCFKIDSSSWPHITTNKWLLRDLSSSPNTKITDWLLYPSPVSCSSALPVTPGFCHHWGNPVKRNPNQLELDQVEAESSNKNQHGCSPGNQGLHISTHLLCPTLGP